MSAAGSLVAGEAVTGQAQLWWVALGGLKWSAVCTVLVPPFTPRFVCHGLRSGVATARSAGLRFEI